MPDCSVKSGPVDAAALRLAVAGLLFALGAVLFAQENVAPLPHAEQLRLADGLYSRGLHALALEEYTRLLTLDPPPANLDVIAFRAGECARALDQNSTALRLYLRVIALGREGETLLRARLRLAELTFDLEKYTSTLAHTQALLDASPPDALAVPALYLRGQAFAAQDQPEEAAEVFRRLRRDWPEDPLAAYAALELAGMTKEVPEAQKLYDEVAENAPSPDVEMEAMWGAFRLTRESGAVDEAAQRGWALWKAHPDGSRIRQALLTLAWTQLQAGQHARAREMAQAATPKQRRLQPDTWLFLDARSADALEKPVEARKALETILADFPDSRFRSLAAYDLAAQYAAAGQHADVLKLAQELKGIPGREHDVDWLLAESYRATGDRASAIKRYDALATLNPAASPRVADAAYLRARLRDETQDADTVEAYQQFARRFPKDARAPGSLHRAGALALKNGEKQKAYDLWSMALDTWPEHPARVDLQSQLASMDAQAGRTEQALKRYADVLQKVEDEARQSDAAFRMGLLHEKSGRTDPAVAAYTRALQGADQDDEMTIRLRLGVLLKNAEQPERAVEALTPLIAQSPAAMPDSLLIWLFRVSEEEEIELPKSGIASAMVAEGRGKVVRELGFYSRARIRWRAGEAEAAVEDWKRGLAFDSRSLESVRARLDLGEVQLSLGRAEQARTTFGQASARASALEESRLQALAMMGVGDAESALGRPEEAARMYLGVSVLFQDEDLTPKALNKAAEAYREAGKPGRAEEVLLRLTPSTAEP